MITSMILYSYFQVFTGFSSLPVPPIIIIIIITEEVRVWRTCPGGEQASFTPLVLSTTGGMGGEALTFYRCLADMLSRHSSTSYSGTLAWIRCTLSFSLLRSATMCIRGTRSILHRSNNASPEMDQIAGPRDF